MSVPRLLLSAPDPGKMGGVASYCRSLVPHFSREPRVVYRGSRQTEAGRPSSLVRLARDTAAVARSVAAGGVEVVHQNTSFARAGMMRDAVVALFARATGKKLFIRLHGWDHKFEPAFASARYGWLRRLYFGADAIGVDAVEFREKLRAWGYRGPIHLESTVVDDWLLDEAPPADPERPFTLLFLARVHRDKGVFQTVDAFRALKDRHPSLRLIVAGDGPALDEARARAAGLPDVQFTGYIRGAEKARVFREAHVYLLPTVHGEGIPTSALEAMAFGLPVITRPMGGLADHLEDGRTGFVTTSTDAAVFAGLVERLIRDPALHASISAHNARYARERFLASSVARRLESIYSSLVA